MRLLLILAMVASSFADNSYVVLAPSWIRANMGYTITVNILQASSSVSVTASLIYDSNAVVTKSGNFQQGTPGTITLKMPSDLGKGSYYLRVAGTGGLTFSKSEKLQVNNKELAVFIQTDKAIYKPGDAVNLRVLAVYSDLTVFSKTLDISIRDADGNVIKRWLDKTPDNGVVTERLTLSSRPVLGDWTITVTALGTEGSKSFAVEKYVLPKFEVKIEAPAYVIKQDSTLDLTVRATYTYGSPVKGTVDVHVTVIDARSTYENTQDGSGVLITDASIDGVYELSVRLDDAADPNARSGNKKVFIIASVTEGSTGNIISSNTTVEIYGDRFNLQFPKSNVDTFRPGLRYTAYLKLTLPDGQPLEDTSDKVKITTSVTDSNGNSRTLQVTEQNVPANGLILISRIIPSDANTVRIRAEFRGRSAYLNLKKSQSPSDSYLQLYGFQNQGNLVVIVSSTQPMGTLVYQIITRGNIVDFGTIGAAGSTYHQFAISTTSFMSPSARIVVYYVRDDGEIVADAISFDVDGMFTNVVSVSVNDTETRPYDPIEVTVEADSSSVAYLLAIDQSVLNKKSGNDIAKLEVFDEIKKFDVVEKLTHDLWPSDAFSWAYPVYYGGEDTETFFKGAGLIAITDATVDANEVARPGSTLKVSKSGGSGGGGGGGGGNLAVAAIEPTLNLQTVLVPESFEEVVDAFQGGAITEPDSYEEPERVRVHFPEAWLWEQLTIGPEGSASLTTQVPDTITSWVVSAFAVNEDSGFGLAPVTRIRTFQPFFIRLNLPYSVVRHERVQVNTVVFNYLDENLLIKVTLSRSDHFDIIETSSDGNDNVILEDAEKISWVAEGSSVPVNFMIVPRKLGKVDIEVTAQAETAADAVRRQLLVKAEGVPGEQNLPIYVDLGDGQGLFETTVDINLPSGIVQGSELFQILVYGDILGPSIAGLDTLLKLPTGCGEQTIVKIIPNVVVLKYLEAVSSLTDEVRNKAIQNIEHGYQNELKYRLVDGSFSVWGKQPGSMSLTAYVIRVFSQASTYITVDTNVIISGIFWMIGKQRSDGSFPEPGLSFLQRYLYNPQNPQDKETVMTLLVLLSLLENENWFDSLTTTQRNNFQQAKQRALSYVETKASQSDDLFILAVASYVFQLGGSSQATVVLNKLEQSATVDGDTKYWQLSSGTTVKALDIETTSYVLLTYALRRDLAPGYMVMKWLIQQRNPHGGFKSTQDTVVALNALSEFAKLTHGDLNLDITVSLDNADTHEFSVTPANIFSRSEDITTIPTQVTVRARGHGVAIVDLAAFYNLLEVTGETTFELTATLLREDIFQVELEACSRWTGEGSASNMAIIEVGVFSGFQVDPNSITQLPTLELIEYEDQKVILYFDEIGTDPVCVRLTFNLVSPVFNLQPAAVKVYDFYDPGNQVTVFYSSSNPVGR